MDGVSWSPTHPDLLATASADKTVRVWDLRGTLIWLVSRSLHLFVSAIRWTGGPNVVICDLCLEQREKAS